MPPAEPVEPSESESGAVPSTGSGPSPEAESVEAPDAASGPVASTGPRSSADTPADRQPVVRVRGARRARLLAAPGTTAEPAPADDPARGTGPRPTASGPNDERMMREVPPHY